MFTKVTRFSSTTLQCKHVVCYDILHNKVVCYRTYSQSPMRLTTLHSNIPEGGIPTFMTTQSQMLKGILEGCILSLMEHREVYGYELSTLLEDSGLTFVSEGSIYPLLLRMQKEQLIEGTLRPAPGAGGPPRKYYNLTDKGRQVLQQFKEHWGTLKDSVDHILTRGGQ